MSVIIKDIVKFVNVFYIMVFRVLNNSLYINEEIKIRIKVLVKEFNYVLNYNVKSLVLLKFYVIGVFFLLISEGIFDIFFYEIIKGISKVIDKEYNFVIRGIDIYESFYLIDNKNFDGIIVVS